MPYMVDIDEGSLGAKVFFVWGATCTACVLFAYFFVPETKSLSLEQVDRMMEEVNPIHSAKWVPHGTYAEDLRMEKGLNGEEKQHVEVGSVTQIGTSVAKFPTTL